MSRSTRQRRKPLRFEVDKDENKALSMCRVRFSSENGRLHAIYWCSTHSLDSLLRRTLSRFQSLLQKLLGQSRACYFKNPVDWQALGLSDYPTIVKHPMDLGTVRDRLGSGFYDTPAAFATDVRLVWSNALLYNPEGDPVRQAAEKLSACFEKLYARVRGVETREAAEADSKDAVAEIPSKSYQRRQVTKSKRKTPRPPKMNFRSRMEELEAMRRDIAILRQRMRRAKYLEERRRMLNPPPSEEERVALMEAISKFHGKTMAGVLAIAAPGTSKDDEVELDFESMPDELVRRLQRYVAAQTAQKRAVTAQYQSPQQSITH